MFNMEERNCLVPKWYFILNLARELVKNKTTMKCKELVCVLNTLGYKTSYGTKYDPNGRGIYKVIISTYYYAKDDVECKDYDVVANAFTKPNGEYAWKE